MSEMKKNGGTWDTREETKHIIGEGKAGNGWQKRELGARKNESVSNFIFFLEVSMPKDQLGQSTRFDRTPTCDRQTDNQRDTAVCRFMASTAL